MAVTRSRRALKQEQVDRHTDARVADILRERKPIIFGPMTGRGQNNKGFRTWRKRKAAAEKGRSILLALLALGVALVCASPGWGAEETRVDLFDKKSNRTGSAIVDEKSGRVDFYDRSSNRTGYGIIDRKSGRVDTYSNSSNRTGSGTISGSSSSRGGKR